MEKVIKINEQQLKNIVAESIRKVLKEDSEKPLPIQIVGGNLEGHYEKDEFEGKYGNLIKGYITPEEYPHLTPKLHGYPEIEGYIGPMFNEVNIRYESPEAYDFFST